MSEYHVPVLYEESIKALNIKSNGVYIDGTLGGGGHFAGIASKLEADGILIGIDQDSEAVELNKRKTFGKCNTIIEKSKYSEFDTILKKHGLNCADGLLLDIGVSSRQIDDERKGFSYRFNSELDMRMDGDTFTTAADILNKSSESKLSEILSTYGEIRNPDRMASAFKKYISENGEIKNTDTLKMVLSSEYGKELSNKVLSKIYQALRIAVNRELDQLKIALEKSVKSLCLGGRIVVISYHSLEDRIVKNFFRDKSQNCICPQEQLVCSCNHVAEFKRITRKAVKASADEIVKNPRARSARLRVAERVS